MYPALHLVGICQGIPLPMHTLDISSITHLPRLVNVVCERTLKENNDFEAIFILILGMGSALGVGFPPPNAPQNQGQQNQQTPETEQPSSNLTGSDILDAKRLFHV